MEDGNDGCFGVGVGGDESGDGAEEGVSFVWGVGAKAAPDLSIDTFGMSLHPHSSDDAELVASSPERPPELGILGP